MHSFLSQIAIILKHQAMLLKQLVILLSDDIIVGAVWEAVQLNILHLRHQNPLHCVDKLSEGGPLLGILIPTVVHDVVYLWGSTI